VQNWYVCSSHTYGFRSGGHTYHITAQFVLTEIMPSSHWHYLWTVPKRGEKKKKKKKKRRDKKIKKKIEKEKEKKTVEKRLTIPQNHQNHVYALKYKLTLKPKYK